MRIKHDKKGKENTIGKIIYGFLLFMPLLAIGVTCAYAIFNKNAYQSYSEPKEITYEDITSLNDFNIHDTFIFTGGNYSVSSIAYEQSRTRINTFTLTYRDVTYQNAYFAFYSSSNNLYGYAGYFVDDVYTQIFNQINAKQIEFSFTYASNNFTQDFSVLSQFFKREEVHVNAYIDNVFYYSIDKVQQSPLFNWAYDTATYNVLESTCNTLGITTLFVPMLLSYWLMISLMYLLYDIALLVVHMAHNKIHDIESSI